MCSCRCLEGGDVLVHFFGQLAVDAIHSTRVPMIEFERVRISWSSTQEFTLEPAASRNSRHVHRFG